MDRIDTVLLVLALAAILVTSLRGPLGLRAKPEPGPQIRVDELIQTLTRQLRENQRRLIERGEAGLFQLSQAEVEVAFVLTRTETAEGQIAAEPVAVTFGQNYERELTHRMKVVLIPRASRQGATAPKGDTNDLP